LLLHLCLFCSFFLFFICAWLSILSHCGWGFLGLARQLLANKYQAALHALQTLHAFLQACLCALEAFQGSGLRGLGLLQTLKYTLFAFLQFLS
jgi:hypothetical protein